MPTVTECPACQRRLRLPEALMGKPVRCPHCGAKFEAEAMIAVPPPLPAEPEEPPNEDAPLALDGGPLIGAAANLPPAPLPLRPVLVETTATEGAGVPLRRCPFCEETVPTTADRCRYCGEDLVNQRPEWERQGAVRRDCEPHRGSLILTLGIIGLVAALIHLFCVLGLPLSIAAWVLGAGDLRDMQAGIMDPQGESNTRAGRTCGIIGTVFGSLWLMLFGLLFLQILLA